MIVTRTWGGNTRQTVRLLQIDIITSKDLGKRGGGHRGPLSETRGGTTE